MTLSSAASGGTQEEQKNTKGHLGYNREGKNIDSEHCKCGSHPVVCSGFPSGILDPPG